MSSARQHEWSYPADTAPPAPSSADGVLPLDALLAALVGYQERTQRPPAAPAETTPLPAEGIPADLGPEGLLRVILGLWGRRPEKRELIRLIDVLAARLERMLEDQVNVVLHHPRFQALESAWRGLRYLCDLVQEYRPQLSPDGAYRPDRRTDSLARVRVLSVSKSELFMNFRRMREFDQSALFKRVYEEEFGTYGGSPFGLLVGDYEFTSHPNDVMLLRYISQVSAAAFAPFVGAVAPQFFQVDHFRRFEYFQNLEERLRQPDYVHWNSLRDSPDARFVALTMPKVLMREPYELDSIREDGFRFRERVDEPTGADYLWGNAAFAFAGVVLRSFASHRWFADIRGIYRDSDGEEGAGLVPPIVTHSFATDSPGVAVKASTDVSIDGLLERELSHHGFLPLCALHGTGRAAFYSSPTIYKPRKMSDLSASTNERIAGMMHYLLCASRIAHYLKKLGQLKIGSFANAGQLEDVLAEWLNALVADRDNLTMELRARHPLRRAQVRVQPMAGKPGEFDIAIELMPHYQLDDLTGRIQLVTNLVAPR